MSTTFGYSERILNTAKNKIKSKKHKNNKPVEDNDPEEGDPGDNSNGNNNGNNGGDKDDDDIDFKLVALTIVIAGFTWVVAVAWNNMMETTFNKCYPYNCKSFKARLIYFLIVTIVAVVIIYYLTKWLSD